jgi:hypothetical protein
LQSGPGREGERQREADAERRQQERERPERADRGEADGAKVGVLAGERDEHDGAEGGQ